MERVEYRITGRTRKSDTRHVIDYNKHWTLQDAQKRLKEVEIQNEYEMKNKTRKAILSGSISIGTEYYSEYDLLEIRIESRIVTPWEIIK